MTELLTGWYDPLTRLAVFLISFGATFSVIFGITLVTSKWPGWPKSDDAIQVCIICNIAVSVGVALWFVKAGGF